MDDRQVTLRIEDGVPWIGDRSFPWAAMVRSDDREYGEVRPWRSRGFHLRFENGWLLSVQFGTGNYCANRDYSFGDGEWHEECPNAEIAAWWGEGGMIDWEESGDSVLGWVPAEKVLDWIDDFMARPSKQVLV
jgi:hypothetical protein